MSWSISAPLLRIVVIGATSAVLVVGVVRPAGREVWAQPGARGENAVVGTLSGYNVKTRVLTVNVDKVVESFVLADKASVRAGSHVLPASAIAAQVGRKVKVRFVESDGRRVVETVMVSRAP